MKITKEDGQLVLRLPLTQKSYDAIDQEIGDVPNLIGVVAGNDFSISQLCDLGYKGTQQEGMPYIVFTDREDLEEVCAQFNLSIWEIPTCTKCKKPIRGTSTWTETGNTCWDCNKD